MFHFLAVTTQPTLELALTLAVRRQPKKWTLFPVLQLQFVCSSSAHQTKSSKKLFAYYYYTTSAWLSLQSCLLFSFFEFSHWKERSGTHHLIVAGRLQAASAFAGVLSGFKPRWRRRRFPSARSVVHAGSGTTNWQARRRRGTTPAETGGRTLGRAKSLAGDSGGSERVSEICVFLDCHQLQFC